MVLLSWPIIAKVHLVHLAANLQTKPTDLGYESAENWLLPSTSTVAIVTVTQPVSWYSFYRLSGVDLSTAVKVHSPRPRLYIAAAVTMNTTVWSVIRTWVLSHRSQTR